MAAKIKKWDKVKVINWNFKWAIFEVEKIEDDKVYWKITITKDWKTLSTIVKKAIKWRGYIEKIRPIHISNVMYYCESCKNASRIWFKLKEWKKYRVCKKCWKEFI